MRAYAYHASVAITNVWIIKMRLTSTELKARCSSPSAVLLRARDTPDAESREYRISKHPFKDTWAECARCNKVVVRDTWATPRVRPAETTDFAARFMRARIQFADRMHHGMKLWIRARACTTLPRSYLHKIDTSNRWVDGDDGRSRYLTARNMFSRSDIYHDSKIPRSVSRTSTPPSAARKLFSRAQ